MVFFRQLKRQVMLFLIHLKRLMQPDKQPEVKQNYLFVQGFDIQLRQISTIQGSPESDRHPELKV